MRKGVAWWGALIIFFVIAIAVAVISYALGTILSRQGIAKRGLFEASLISESDRVETHARSFLRATDLSSLQAIHDSGTEYIVLPYDFDAEYSQNYEMAYWQIYDEKQIPPVQIMKDKARQEISWISSSYLKDYRDAFNDFIQNLAFQMDFSDSSILEVTDFTSNNINTMGGEMWFYRETEVEDQAIIIDRKFNPYSEINTEFGRVIELAEEIIDNDVLGKCVREEPVNCNAGIVTCDYDETSNTCDSLQSELTDDLAPCLIDGSVTFEFACKNFYPGSGNPAAIIQASIVDGSVSYPLYNFNRDDVILNYLGVNFLTIAGYKTNPDPMNDIEDAQNLDDWNPCSSRLGIISPNNDICNFFIVSPATCTDPDSTPDSTEHYTVGTCEDFTGSYEDKCVGDMDYEYYCYPVAAGEEICHYETFECPEGCDKGACLPYCNDLDGEDYYNASKVEYDGQELLDECEDGTYLLERVCDGTNPSTDRVACAARCENGRCVKECEPGNDIICHTNYPDGSYDSTCSSSHWSGHGVNGVCSSDDVCYSDYTCKLVDAEMTSYTLPSGTYAKSDSISLPYTTQNTGEITWTFLDETDITKSDDTHVFVDGEYPQSWDTINPGVTMSGTLSYDITCGDPTGTWSGLLYTYTDQSAQGGWRVWPNSGSISYSFTVVECLDNNDCEVCRDVGYTCNVSTNVCEPPNQPPVASFTESAETVNTGERIDFDASESNDPDGSIVSYFWDFGDGNNATGVSVSHSYNDDGSYTVTLTVTDNDGATASASSTKTVLNRPPVATIIKSASEVNVDESITFDASFSYDPDGSIVSYYWDFGDGNNATGVSVSHSYYYGGSYTVTLTVTDDDGATGSATTTITVIGDCRDIGGTCRADSDACWNHCQARGCANYGCYSGYEQCGSDCCCVCYTCIY